MDELKERRDGKKSDKALLEQAKKRFKDCVDLYEDERKK